MPIVLHMAEIKDARGQVLFRFGRVPDPQGGWLRHGVFVAYFEDGTVKTEGAYDQGLETGPWREFHENGTLAAEGDYRFGREHGLWRYYDRRGVEEREVRYLDGLELAAHLH